MLVAAYQAERQTARRDHRAPSLRLTDHPGAKADESFQLGRVADLDIEVNAGSMIADLLVDVGISSGRLEAPEFWIAGPAITEFPAQSR
jgi:hypothetical protein